jgi:hypothetical protein
VASIAVRVEDKTSPIGLPQWSGPPPPKPHGEIKFRHRLFLDSIRSMLYEEVSNVQNGIRQFYPNYTILQALDDDRGHLCGADLRQHFVCHDSFRGLICHPGSRDVGAVYLSWYCLIERVGVILTSLSLEHLFMLIPMNDPHGDLGRL